MGRTLSILDYSKTSFLPHLVQVIVLSRDEGGDLTGVAPE